MGQSLHRVLIDRVRLGFVPLPADAFRHLVRVLRLGEADLVRVFDGGGGAGQGRLTSLDGVWHVEVGQVDEGPASPAAGCRVEVASAVPKGERADWMVEKLAEMGVARWVPLRTARSVVHPEGVEKFSRWRRLCESASRQCGRADVMEVGELVPLADYSRTAATTDLRLFASLLGADRAWPAWPLQGGGLRVMVGPEGDFSPEENDLLLAAGWQPVGLGATVLRVETAAMVAAAIAGRRSLLCPE